MAWLEIENNNILGVHSHKGSSPCEWCKSEEPAEPGDQFIDGKVVKLARLNSEARPKRSRKARAERHIQKYYSIQDQINLLSENDKEALKLLNDFIQSVNDWIEKNSLTINDLKAIKPK